MTFAAIGAAGLWFVPVDVPPPSEQFGFLPIMLLALLAMALLAGTVILTRHRRKGQR
jgi:hypothetical protein